MMCALPLDEGERMLWSKWTAGPETGTTENVFVSVTLFRARSLLDMPSIIWSGQALQKRWIELPGAIGVWTWLDMPRKCSGSVSIWREEADMRAFVRWKPHVQIVKKHREAGKMTSSSWIYPRLDRRAIRLSAEGLLAEWIGEA
jgi:hypothetical protein